MYRICEEKDRERYIMLIPAMLDAHFPLLQYAFYSPDYRPVILENEAGITDVGLKYVNNDMCYPAILNIGQMIAALQSGAYDVSRTVLLMPQAGDACRGSNYTSKLRRAVKKAGFSVPVLSLNAKGLEKGQQVRLHSYMVWRAFVAVMYGDLIMILENQIHPYERTRGDTKRKVQEWLAKLSEDLKQGRHLGVASMKRRFAEIAEDFASIPRQERECRKVGLVGELYTKYCHLGNWNLLKDLAEQKCECYVNGLSWYVLYYIDTHLGKEGFLMEKAYQMGFQFILKMQREMVQAIRRQGFYVMDEFVSFKEHAKGYVSFDCCIGDGWLMGAEIVNHARNGYSRVIAAQPFGCMPNHVCGRGLYPSLSRKLENVTITSVDYDSGGSSLNVKNRIRMALDYKMGDEI